MKHKARKAKESVGQFAEGTMCRHSEVAAIAPTLFRFGWSAFSIKLLCWCLILGTGYTYLVLHFRAAVNLAANFSASVSGSLVSIFPGETMVERNLITHQGFSVEIIDECLGGIEAMMLVSAILAVSVPWRRKLNGIVIGTAVVYLFNLVRISALAVAGGMSGGIFTFLHIYLGQATLILVIVAIWFIWLRYATK